MEKTEQIELHERRFIFKGEDLQNSIIEDFTFSLLNNDEHKGLGFSALFQEVTNFGTRKNGTELYITGYSILEHLQQEKINEIFLFNQTGKEVVYSEYELPFIIFNDQEAEGWQIELYRLSLESKREPVIVEEKIEEKVEEEAEEKEEEEEEEEEEKDGLIIEFKEDEKPVVYKIEQGERTKYDYQGEIGDTMTFANGNKIVEYNTETNVLTEIQ